MIKKLLALFVALIIAAAAYAAVNINTADAAALESLKGVGKVTAKAIVAERDANGPFKDFKDLSKRVKGVGKKTVEKLKEAGATIGEDEAMPAKQG